MPYTEMVALWTGPGGLPGYSKFRFIGTVSGTQLDTAAANLRTFLFGVRTTIPTVVTIAIQSGVSYHNDDGTLTGEGTISTLPLSVTGTGSGSWSATSGWLALWNTGAINGGKKVRGRTYFVPAVASIFDVDGTITEATRATMLTLANAFAASTPSPAVNSRSRAGNPAAGNQTTAMLSATISDKQVVLRSRRD